MSMRSLFLWCLTVFFVFAAAMMMVPLEARVSTLEQGMGPIVDTDPL